MKRNNILFSVILYAIIISATYFIAVGVGKGTTVFREREPLFERKCVVIDPGHGGIDGGTTSCTGILESKINLEIAQKTNHLMHLLGIKTIMTRNTDRSIHTEGNTIASQKLSDLKERIRIANTQNHAILISIHQNYFTSSAYSGAQVFYGKNEESKVLAEILQSSFIQTINPGSHRQIKQAKSIYLMDKVECPAVLVECGFLSNPQEEFNLRDHSYQLAIGMILSSKCSEYLFVNNMDMLDQTRIN